MSICMSYKNVALSKNWCVRRNWHNNNKTDKTSGSKDCKHCHYWFFKDVSCKLKPHLGNKCHDVLKTAYELKTIAVLNVKGVECRCILWGISKNEAVSILNNSVLEHKCLLKMVFSINKTSVEVIKEGVFGGTYFREIYSGVNGKWYRKWWKEFDELRVLINMVLNVERH